MGMRPSLISVIIPNKNEGAQLKTTIQSLVTRRSTAFPLQIVVVDDGSTDGSSESILKMSDLPCNVDLRVRVLGSNYGIPYARNRGAEWATSPIYLITDGNTIFPANWDLPILRSFRPNRILAGTILDTKSSFRGYGCTLVLPSMGTRWISAPSAGHGRVPVAACSCTVIDQNLFRHLGGYDESLPIYGAAEPEFSLRAWLHGYEIVNVPDLAILHSFRPRAQFNAFRASIQHMLVRNYLRFSCYYLPERQLLRTYDHYAAVAPRDFQQCIAEGVPQDSWGRREELKRLPYDFKWFATKFDLAFA